MIDRLFLHTGIGTLRPWLDFRARAFERALDSPLSAQDRLLGRIIRKMAGTAYGRAFGLEPSDSYAELRRKLPIVQYEDLAPWIERQKASQASFISPDGILFYEKTSGSSGPAKYIPYNRGLKEAFHGMFALWLGDLLRHGPRFRSGKMFFSVSPAFANESLTALGVPIGLEDDADYLSPVMRRWLGRFFVAPSWIKSRTDPFEFKLVLALFLLSEPDLEIISIWHPSYLEVMLEFIVGNADRLAEALAKGNVELSSGTISLGRPRPQRARLLSEGSVSWERIWPTLKLISCWGDGPARDGYERLKRAFPSALVQAKGLLATEAAITIPWHRAGGFVPLLHSCFFELIDASGRCHRLHELETGETYELVITQQGGLCRYRLGDRVRVSGRYRESPCLEFCGRGERISDLVGEKLSEAFVSSAMTAALHGRNQSSFRFLLPHRQGKECRYVLVAVEDEDPSQTRRALEQRLQESYHYRNARLLGQLQNVEVIVAPAAKQLFFECFQRKGMKWGDIKPQYLVADREFSEIFFAQLGQAIGSPSRAHSAGE